MGFTRLGLERHLYTWRHLWVVLMVNLSRRVSTIVSETVWVRHAWLDGKKFLGLSTVLVHVIPYLSNFDKTINSDSRSFLSASYRSFLRSYILSPISSPPSPALIQLLESPRVTFLTVRAGADVFVRNCKGKMAHEGAGKDDRVKVFLRQCMSLSVISDQCVYIFFF